VQQILPKTAEICQNLPKDETLKFHQKSRFLVEIDDFLKVPHLVWA
jgi:hypothetical protein